jgi:hypothetical protein
MAFDRTSLVDALSNNFVRPGPRSPWSPERRDRRPSPPRSRKEKAGQALRRRGGGCATNGAQRGAEMQHVARNIGAHMKKATLARMKHLGDTGRREMFGDVMALVLAMASGQLVSRSGSEMRRVALDRVWKKATGAHTKHLGVKRRGDSFEMINNDRLRVVTTVVRLLVINSGAERRKMTRATSEHLGGGRAVVRSRSRRIDDDNGRFTVRATRGTVDRNGRYNWMCSTTRALKTWMLERSRKEHQPTVRTRNYGVKARRRGVGFVRR